MCKKFLDPVHGYFIEVSFCPIIFAYSFVLGSVYFASTIFSDAGNILDPLPTASDTCYSCNLNPFPRYPDCSCTTADLLPTLSLRLEKEMKRMSDADTVRQYRYSPDKTSLLVPLSIHVPWWLRLSIMFKKNTFENLL